MTEQALIQWWQLLPHRLDPYIFQIGSFRVGWYGMMYVFGAATFYALASYRNRKESLGYEGVFLQDTVVWLVFGLILGARLGYVLFYNPGYYLSHPLEIILPVAFTPQGLRYTGISGMSYHGGVLGAVGALWWMLRKHKQDFWRYVDYFTPGVPLGYTFGRLGNFINGELYGRYTTAPWGMYFPMDPSHQLRHPSQLYEAALEGLVLFAVLWTLKKREFFKGIMFPTYIFGYGFVRFFIEYFREPDAHLGLVLTGMSMGQVLCASMMALGVGTAVWLKRSGR